MRFDIAIYGVHGLFWAAFGITRTILARRDPAKLGPPAGATTEISETAPHSRALMAVHMFGFGLLYFGLANAVLPNRVPHLFPLQWLVGTVVILMGSCLMCWALVFFRSWRFRAKLDAGHELA